MMSFPNPKPVAAPELKPMPMKTASASEPKAKSKSAVKTAKASSKTGRSVLKVAYDEDEISSVPGDNDAPPAVPASIRRAAGEQDTIMPTTRFAAKPAVHLKSADVPANPLRP
jgi:hypothetical protein